jgi:hypothetical protein
MEIGGRAPWARWSGAGRDFGWPNLNKVGRAEENRHGYRELARQGRASSAEAGRHGSLGKERVEGTEKTRGEATRRIARQGLDGGHGRSSASRRHGKDREERARWSTAGEGEAGCGTRELRRSARRRE